MVIPLAVGQPFKGFDSLLKLESRGCPVLAALRGLGTMLPRPTAVNRLSWRLV